MPAKIKTIITHPHFQADTLAALAILAYFGEAKYPGISEAPVQLLADWSNDKNADQLEAEGILALDMGGGKFDHHRQAREQEKKCLTDLVIEDLGLKGNSIVDKLRQYARRDDLQGKGTLSNDTIDRAFGLSGLIQNLNRRYKDNPNRIIQIIIPLLEAHLWEEEQRHSTFPEEYQQAQAEGRLVESEVFQDKKMLKVIAIESDVIGLVGFLRAYQKVKADLVAQRLSSGHVNIVTNQQRQVDLNGLVALLRIAEAKKKRIPFDRLPKKQLTAKGKLEGLEEWYYDTAANSIQNGGIRPESANPTNLNFEEIKKIIAIGLNPQKLQEYLKKNFPKFVIDSH